MTPFPRFTTAFALVLALAGAGGALAADSQPQPQSGMMGMGRMSHMCGTDSDARQAAHMAYMETALKLSDAQKAEFKKLGEAMKTSHEPMKALCGDTQAKANLSMPQRMEAKLKMMEARAAAMKTELPAMTRFYNSLTPDQQKLADTMMDRGKGMGMGMGMMGGGHHGHY